MSYDIEAQFDHATGLLKAVKGEIGTIIYGQDSVIDYTLTTLISGGHVLLIGVPGVAKTLLVETIATILGLNSKRVQCTPDLMPSDVLGSEVLEENATGTRSFRFIEGPVFTQILMADEINRASPRTQSALLQAMQEREVSVAGKARNLPEPFHVLATQNPIEQEGTYPLPEAQLDRFLMQIDVDYPSKDAERQVMLSTTSNTSVQAQSMLQRKDLIEIQSLVRDMPIGEKVVEAILTLVRSARPEDHDAPDFVKHYVSWAPGPRGAQGMMLAVRAKALLDGRSAPSIDDVVDLAKPILQHRMAVNFKARSEGIAVDDIVRKLCARL